ncbi:hypothetical protein ACTWJ8_34650 [Streptomyces sp. SDT5-1]|uniref:hypothetical protein n=1 Tax=Streptomyces sp. SDT5-1 TaxID=3406418 RepID=UPI003FD44465
MTRTSAPEQLMDDIARAVADVPGVAFLRPALAGRLRSALGRPGASAGGAASGVRITPPRDADDVWRVEIHLVALADARAVDVARAARRTAGEALSAGLPGDDVRPSVTVTVTGLV